MAAESVNCVQYQDELSGTVAQPDRIQMHMPSIKLTKHQTHIGQEEHCLNASGKWRVGVKHLYELVPMGLKKRIKQDRRKLWDEQQSLSVAKAWSDLSKHLKGPTPSTKPASPEVSTSAEGDDYEAAGTTENEAGTAKDSKQIVSQKLIKEELQARVDLLKELAEGYDDPGTSCLLFWPYLLDNVVHHVDVTTGLDSITAGVVCCAVICHLLL